MSTRSPSFVAVRLSRKFSSRHLPRPTSPPTITSSSRTTTPGGRWPWRGARGSSGILHRRLYRVARHFDHLSNDAGDERGPLIPHSVLYANPHAVLIALPSFRGRIDIEAAGQAEVEADRHR